jgi:DNA repair protein RadC
MCELFKPGSRKTNKHSFTFFIKQRSLKISSAVYYMSVHSGTSTKCDGFKKEGLEGFSCYNVLEMLLFFAIPRSDTNVVAHNLIDEFGSLPSVFEASYEDLLKVKGIGPHSATLLTLDPQITQRYLSEKTPKNVFSDMEEVKK